METYLYMTVVPEALVGSMLNPETFAPYLATGSRKSSHGRAIFFEVDRAKLPPVFNFDQFDAMAPHPDGSPKRSQTICIYRVLEHIPLEALGRMFIVTRDGKYLAIPPQPYEQPAASAIRLYQELCPIRPTLVSKLQPKDFGKYVAKPGSPVHVPRIFFADLVLGSMADPTSQITQDMLPYADMGNIRDAIETLKNSKRETLMVDRAHSSDFFYRTVGEGFFVADAEQIIHYPFPTHEELEGRLHSWWRSAELS